MKRSNSKELNILTTVIVLSLAFLCIFNITYSYFTASAKIYGDTDFANIKVNFYYTTSSSNGIAPDGENALIVSPANMVSRDEPFSIKYLDEELTSVGFKADATSCNVYIRFWIDAYVTSSDDSDISATNYGRYFSFYYGNTSCTTLSDAHALRRLETADESNYTYFIPTAIGPNDTYTPFNRILLDDNIPEELLGASIRITIRFEAIQSSNGACKTWERYKTDENGDFVLDENNFFIINDNKGIINDIVGNEDYIWDTGV